MATNDWLLMLGGVLFVAAIATGVVWFMESFGAAICDQCEQATNGWGWITLSFFLAGALTLIAYRRATDVR